MIEVEITNFQSIASVKLQIKGFTALVGRSNIGKSAVVRAIKCALTAPKGTDFVRHGEACERRIKGNKKCRCQTMVRFKTGPLELTWEKGDSVNKYTVVKDGETTEYTAIGSGSPEFLHPEFEPVGIGSKDTLLQVHEQFSRPFLLDESGSTVADVLSDVARLDNINTAIRLANKDRKEAVTTRKVREKDLAHIRGQLDRYEGFDDTAERVKDVETGHQALQEAQERLEWLAEHLEDLEETSVSVAALRAATAKDLPDGEELKAQGDKLLQLVEWHEEIVARAPDLRRLMGVKKIDFPEIEGLIERGGKLAQVSKWVDQLIKFKEVMGRFKGLSKVKLSKAPPSPENLDQVKRWCERHEELEKAEAELVEQLASADTELSEVLAEFDELGVCPTCTQKFDAEHVHRGVA